MPGDSGRATPMTNNGGTRRTNVASTPITNNINLPNGQDLTARLTATHGLVKCASEAKVYLEQRSLITIDNNCGINTLANLLITTLFEPRIPDHAVNVMRAVVFLMMNKYQNIFAKDLVVIIAEKLSTASEHPNVQLECELNFLVASDTSQANHTQQLTNLVTLLMKTSQELSLTSQNISKSADNIAKSTSEILPFTQTISSMADHINSIADSAKALVKAVDDLKSSPPTPNSIQQTTSGTSPPYANAVTNSTPCPMSSSPYNSDMLEYVTCIENRLQIQECQVYITFDNNMADSPKEHSRTAAFALHGKINEWIRSLDQEAHQVMSPAGQPIKVLQFTERGAILLKFESKEYTDHFNTYCRNNNLLRQICSTVKIQPHTYQVVIKFVPCDGSFSPKDNTQLCAIEAEHNLDKGAIVAAMWIKEPERHSPGQKTANVKVLCATPNAANRLLTECVFIANSRVVITKDIQEPIRCNKCQEYGHIREQCENPKRCSNCTRAHPVTECNYPNDPHCVSCGTSSMHASSDRGNCPQFSRHLSTIDACLLENSMPYFLISGQPSTFALAAKPIHTHSTNYSNCPQPQTNLSNSQQQQQQHQNQPPPPQTSNTLLTSQHNLQQTTLDQRNNSANQPSAIINANASPSRPTDNGWQTQHRHREATRLNPNNIPLSWPSSQPQTLFQYGFVPNPPTQFQPVSQFYNANDFAPGASWQWITHAQLECQQTSESGSRMHVNLHEILTIFLILQIPQNLI